MIGFLNLNSEPKLVEIWEKKQQYSRRDYVRKGYDLMF